MLQNPSKYHANPLTHFLALHQSQVGHTQPHSLAPPSTAIGLHQNGQHHHPANHLHPMQQQQTQFGQQHHDHHAAAAAAAAVAIMGGSHHHHHHHPHHSHHLNSSQLIEAANTTLDVGKSFTIAAILGLQKSAIESNRKDYNNAINLSINGNGHSDDSQRDLTESLTDDDDGGSEKDPHRSFPGRQSINNNNNENVNTSTGGTTTNGTGSKSNAGVSFNCDSNIVNRFLPPLNATQSAFGSTHQQAMAAAAAAQQQQSGAGFPTAAAANGSSSVAARTPTALQSLQQLHQQHAQQTSMAFHREKLKTDASSTKKSSLKNKRVRTIFTPEQLERLEGEFERQQYMVGPERLYLAHTLQLTEAQVKVWFQNRRIKWRKHHLEITQQRLALLRQSQLTATPSGINGSNSANSAVTGAIGSGMQISSAASIPSCDDGDEDEDYNKQHEDEIRQLSRNASESDLSICNDSIDGDSVVEGADDP